MDGVAGVINTIEETVTSVAETGGALVETASQAGSDALLTMEAASTPPNTSLLSATGDSIATDVAKEVDRNGTDVAFEELSRLDLTAASFEDALPVQEKQRDTILQFPQRIIENPEEEEELPETDGKEESKLVEMKQNEPVDLTARRNDKEENDKEEALDDEETSELLENENPEDFKESLRGKTQAELEAMRKQIEEELENTPKKKKRLKSLLLFLLSLIVGELFEVVKEESKAA
ncbi:MAG TPA: hypothetical protein VLF89_06480 [Candidatus Saccharimonadales bacterium]|nr:hypothetical protein [Candidatus Saccharimonadales bacterium]